MMRVMPGEAISITSIKNDAARLPSNQAALPMHSMQDSGPESNDLGDEKKGRQLPIHPQQVHTRGVSDQQCNSFFMTKTPS